MKQWIGIIMVMMLVGCLPNIREDGTDGAPLNELQDETTVLLTSTLVVERPAAVESEATVVPLPTMTLVPQPMSGEVATAVRELFLQSIPPIPAPNKDGYVQGINDVVAVDLGNDYWLAHTVGTTTQAHMEKHIVAVYLYVEGMFQEVARTPMMLPVWLMRQSVHPLNLGDGTLWFGLDSQVGVHGACFQLLHMVGETVQIELEHCSAGLPTNGPPTDIDGNGLPEIVLDLSDHHLICYACNVIMPIYEVYSWRGEGWFKQVLAQLPESAPPLQRDTNNRAVALAQAGLWKEANALIHGLEPIDPIVIWNRRLINLHAAYHERRIVEPTYPLLNYLFYGDYETALTLMVPYTPEQLFMQADNPLVVGSVFEGTEAVVGYWTVFSADAALTVKPDLAEAYFMRGWGQAISGKAQAEWIGDMETAVSLAPDTPLFAESLQYLTQ